MRRGEGERRSREDLKLDGVVAVLEEKVDAVRHLRDEGDFLGRRWGRSAGCINAACGTCKQGCALTGKNATCGTSCKQELCADLLDAGRLKMGAMLEDELLQQVKSSLVVNLFSRAQSHLSWKF